MGRVTDGLPSPSHSVGGNYPHRQESKQHARRALSDSGTTYEKIATATGRSITIVYDKLNMGNDRRHLTYADLIALSRHTGTKQFVAHLLQPIEQNMRGAPKPDGK